MGPSIQVQPSGDRSLVWAVEPLHLGLGGYSPPCPHWLVQCGPRVVHVSWSACQAQRHGAGQASTLTLLLSLLPRGHQQKGPAQGPGAHKPMHDPAPRILSSRGWL